MQIRIYCRIEIVGNYVFSGNHHSKLSGKCTLCGDVRRICGVLFGAGRKGEDRSADII